MKKFLKHLHIVCATMLMTTVFAVNASAAIKEENILLKLMKMVLFLMKKKHTNGMKAGVWTMQLPQEK